MESKSNKALKQELDKVLKKAVSKFGVNLERYIADLVKIYSGSSYGSIRDTVKQDLGFLIRDCIDDRGWYFEKHSSKIEEFLLKHVSRISDFPEPLLFQHNADVILDRNKTTLNKKLQQRWSKLYTNKNYGGYQLFRDLYFNKWVGPADDTKKVNLNCLPLNIKLKLL